MRATAEVQAMGFHQRSSRAYMRSFQEKGVTTALSERDRAFGDYREAADEQQQEQQQQQ
jgi:enoyl-CoA hydratase